MHHFFFCAPSRFGLWHRHPQIHPDGARAALRLGADWGPVQVHLLVCVRVHPGHQSQRLRLPGEWCLQSTEEMRHKKCKSAEKNVLKTYQSKSILSAADRSTAVQHCSWERWALIEAQEFGWETQCLCLGISDRLPLRLQETETEYGNLQLKHQRAARKPSKWVACMCVCVYGCVLCVFLWEKESDREINR